MEEKTSEVKEETTESFEETPSSEYADFTLDELEDSLKKAVDNEEYEKASKIRDEIESRKKGK
jgi:protein-arginine kinase activator protein McsA